MNKLILNFILGFISINVIAQTKLSQEITSYNDDPWVEESKKTFAFDDNGRLKEIEFFYYDSGWEKEGKDVFTYNSTGAVTQIDGLAYIGPNNWENATKILHTLNANDDITEKEEFEWINNTWANEYKREYTVDQNGNRTLEIGYDWVNNTWEENIKIERTFDAQNNRLEYTTYFWNEFNRVWSVVSKAKNEYAYDANNRIITELAYSWDETVWILIEKTENIYDQDDNIIKETLTGWYENEWDTNNRSEVIYNYSTDYIRSELTLPTFDYFTFPSNFKNQPIGFIEADYEDGMRYEGLKVDFSYDDEVIGIFDINKSQTNTYPNPANDYLTFELESNTTEQVDIYNMLGGKVKTSIISNKNQIDISDLTSGMYFYKTSSLSGKFLKK